MSGTSSSWKKPALIAVLAALVVAVGFWQRERLGFGGREGHGRAADAGPPKQPAAVRVLKLELMPTQEAMDFSGSVQSRKVVQVSSEVLARIVQLPFRAGMAVKKGDLLVALDAKVVETQVKQAEEAVGAAEALVSAAEAAVRGQEANRDEAEKDYQRYQETYKAGAASQQQLQQAEARLKSAVAAVQSAQEQVSVAQRQTEAARQRVREAQEMRQKTEIRSPMDAVVVDRLAEPGDLAAPGRALLTLQSATDLRFEAPISESCARRINEGDEVRIKVDAAGLDLTSRVREIVPAVDPQSRSFLVRADLPARPGLQPGMFGRLSFSCGLRPALRIPAAALFTRGQLDCVFVVQDGRARLRLVKPGREAEGSVEIVAGLGTGDEIVLDPPPTLNDGDPVTPIAEAQPKA